MRAIPHTPPTNTTHPGIVTHVRSGDSLLNRACNIQQSRVAWQSLHSTFIEKQHNHRLEVHQSVEEAVAAVKKDVKDVLFVALEKGTDLSNNRTKNVADS